MTEEELNSAIKTDSLWENLVQLTDNLSDYSIFHQVVKRDDVANTMDILFVASKLSDVSTYTSIVEKGGLNPVIVDVKCFSLKSAVDQMNQIAAGSEIENLTAVLEFGLDENYIMILHESNPIITDIFIRSQDRNTLLNSDNQEEMDALVRRYTTQVKQSITADLLNDTTYRISATLSGNSWDEQSQNDEIIGYITPFNLYDPMVEDLEYFNPGGLYAEGVFDIEVATNNWGNTEVDFDIKATVYSANPSDIYCGTPSALCQETFFLILLSKV